jgi:hypothetical protein
MRLGDKRSAWLSAAGTGSTLNELEFELLDTILQLLLAFRLLVHVVISSLQLVLQDLVFLVQDEQLVVAGIVKSVTCLSPGFSGSLR